tara:strand:- start:2026 stop:2817 length:792 start_codon:yes stop_codon:yes gene_type:complete
MSEIKYDKKRLNPVKSILVSQPDPKDENSPFYRLARKYDLKLDFKPFIKIDPVSIKEFRKQKINILNHTAIIFTSRNAVDHFFRIAEGMNVTVPTDMKYFCNSEQTANYLQKYIVIRKRKIFTGERTIAQLLDMMKDVMIKFPDEKYLFPCSNITRDTISQFLKDNECTYSEAIIYNTVPSDLKRLKKVFYDILVFYTPYGIDSLVKNFPDFEQNNTRIAGFGKNTAKAIKENNLKLDIKAPMKDVPSMTRAIELYIKQSNNL